MLNGILGGKYDGTCRCSGRSCDTLADGVSLFECCSVELRVEKHIERLCVDLHESLLLGDHALIDKIACDLDSSGSGTLTVSGLKHVELLILDGELHVLHIAVVVLEGIADSEELLVNLGENFLHLLDRHRSTNACNDVLALCVHKELAHEALLAGCGVTGERNACTGGVAHVSERHHLYVDCGTPGVRDIVVHTVDVRTGVVPRTEN